MIDIINLIILTIIGVFLGCLIIFIIFWPVWGTWMLIFHIIDKHYEKMERRRQKEIDKELKNYKGKMF